MTPWKRVAVALVCVAVVFPAASASARTSHRHAHHAHHPNAHHVRHHPHAHYRGYADTPAVEQPQYGFFDGWGDTGLVAKARSYVGETASQLGLPRSLWCADFMNLITGGGTHSREAKSYLRLPHTSPHVGAIAVLSRRRGGHVGVVSGFDANGNPIIVSGNHGHTVGEGVYSKKRVIAYVAAHG